MPPAKLSAPKKAKAAADLTELAKQIKSEVATAGGSPETAVVDAASYDVDYFSTGSVQLNYAINSTGKLGGIPRGRIIEIYGPEFSGKTLLCSIIAANTQAEGGNVTYVDAERRLNVNIAREMGLQVGSDKLLLVQPDSAEQAFDWVERAARAGSALIVVDSIAALLPKQEGEQNHIEDANVGLMARLNAKAMRRLTGILSRSDTSLILVNQVREKIGVMYGNPETTTGGRAIRFFSSLRLRVSKKMGADGIVKRDGEDVGYVMRVEIVKNSFGKLSTVELPFVGGEGFDTGVEMAEMALELGLVEQAGAWIKIPNTEFKAQGKDRLAEYIRTNPEFEAAIQQQLQGQLEANEREHQEIVERHNARFVTPQPTLNAEELATLGT